MVSEVMFLLKNVFPVALDWFPPMVGIISWHGIAELQLGQYRAAVEHRLCQL